MARLVMARSNDRLSSFRITFLSPGSTVIMEMTLTSPEGQLRLPLPAEGWAAVSRRVASILPARSTPAPLLLLLFLLDLAEEARNFRRVSLPRASFCYWMRFNHGDAYATPAERRLLQPPPDGGSLKRAVLLMRNRWQKEALGSERIELTLLWDFNSKAKGGLSGRKPPSRLLKHFTLERDFADSQKWCLSIERTNAQGNFSIICTGWKEKFVRG